MPCLAATTQQHSLESKVCLENSKEAQCAFSNLAVDLPNIKEEVPDIEKFICALLWEKKAGFR